MSAPVNVPVKRIIFFMEIEVQPISDNRLAVLVRLEGEFMLPDTIVFKNYLENLLLEGRIHLVLDLTDLSYIVSSGLGIIIMILKKARAQGGDLKFIKLRDGLVKNLFQMTRFDELIDMCDDLNQALDRFN